MEVSQVVINQAADVVFNAREAPRQFDLEEENINGFFTNLTLLSMLLTSVSGNMKSYSIKQTFKEEYDYVIVGAGTAGSVMANRLSGNPCISVLLLEAGGEPPILTEVPLYSSLFFKSKIDWLYQTVPQRYTAFSQKNNIVNLNCGKAVGGSSILNAMVYVRGNKKNFDDWERDGCTGWNYDEVFPYFLKLEDNRHLEGLDVGYHRTGGPQTVENPYYTPEIKNPVLEATAEMGYEKVDVNGRTETGIFDLQTTMRDQQRCSTEKAYLRPARDRPNLDILTHAFARKILISANNGVKTAYGVEFDHLGKTQTVRARKEVILSNGAIRTPQTLILSGIGPREQLEKLNIPVVADLPVGKNLQDHCGTSLVYTVDETIVPGVVKKSDPVNILNYIDNRKGPLTLPNGLTLLAFLDGLNTSQYSRDFPRQELYFGDYFVLDAKVNQNVKDDVYDRVFAPYVTKPVYLCFATILAPYSRGEVTLSSTNPYDIPLIDPRYYEDERDLMDIVEAIKICNAIARHPAMKQVKAQWIETQKTGFPNCEGLEGNEDQYFACLARQILNTIYHYSGTAKMGSRNDSRSVVDPELRVIGVENLRVISAAVMPIITSGNINIPTMMIAERAYGMMEKDINCFAGRTDRRMYGPWYN